MQHTHTRSNLSVYLCVFFSFVGTFPVVNEGMMVVWLLGVVLEAFTHDSE